MVGGLAFLALAADAALGGDDTGAQPASQPAQPGLRYHPPSKWILGPWYGTGYPEFGRASGSKGTHEDEINYDLDNLAKHDIPITCYHCDGTAWAKAGRANLSDKLVQRLRCQNARLLLHMWGQDDIGKWKDTHQQLSGVLGGFYLDEKWGGHRGADDRHSQQAIETVRALLPRDGEVVLKTYAKNVATDECLRKLGHTCYVNDLGCDFRGIREGIRRVFSKAHLLPGPFNEFTAYDVNRHRRPDEETYFRQLHWGAMQVVMDNTPWIDADPWLWDYSPKLLEAYRYYSWLHLELAAYLHSYDYHAYETNEMIFRQSDPQAFTTKLGEELFVAYVTDSVKELRIELPQGQWINYWDESQIFNGPGRITHPVPLGREPIFLRNGSIIPMDVTRPYTGHGTTESAGSLTVLVYPKDTCTFKYRDEKLDAWVTFQAAMDQKVLALTASRGPSRPVLYRIARWQGPPQSVSVEGLAVTINRGGGMPKAAGEKEVNGASANAWFYDAAAKRLIIKAFLKP
jgi:hypothetical protein